MCSIEEAIIKSNFLVDDRFKQIITLYSVDASGPNATAKPNLQNILKNCKVKIVEDFFFDFFIRLSNDSSYNDCQEKKLLANIPQTDTAFYVTFILTFIFVIVGIVGFLGNLLTILVIKKTKSLHNQTNYFLACLACSDFLLILVGVPFDLINIWHPRRFLNVLGYCEITSTTISLFTFASIIVIVLLSFERFIAIVYPFSLRSRFDKQMAIRVIIFTWIFAFFPSIFIGMQFKPSRKDFCGFTREASSGIRNCDYIRSNLSITKYTFEAMLLLTFVLPVLFILFCYVRILQTLSQMTAHLPVAKTNSNGRGSMKSNESRRESLLQVHSKANRLLSNQKAQKAVMKMLITVAVVFFLFYLPYHIQRLLVSYTGKLCDDSFWCRLLYPITGLLQYFSAMLNPFIYNIMSLRFRNAFRIMIHNIVNGIFHSSNATDIELRQTNKKTLI
uniref:G_PROTEIN_RECEP_F1_2 domain-containing protein n=1 Tax=Rhabditophanes sp. KR3021 TaxID=114890 RepID=A0AC35TKF8_9BILA